MVASARKKLRNYLSSLKSKGTCQRSRNKIRNRYQRNGLKLLGYRGSVFGLVIMKYDFERVSKLESQFRIDPQILAMCTFVRYSSRL